MNEREETYQVTIGCNNCGTAATYTLPKGNTVIDCLSDIECKHCACKGFMRSIDYYTQSWPTQKAAHIAKGLNS